MQLKNPIIYWYCYGFKSEMVTEVWDYMIANNMKGKPVAMCKNEYEKLK